MTNSVATQTITIVSIAAAGLLTADIVTAAPNLVVDVGAGAEYHSNAARTSADEKADTAAVARASLAWRDQASPVSGDAGYSIEHRDYLDDVEEDETAVNGRANLNWHALPRRLDVIFQHQSSQTQTDLRTADTPSNRERRTILTGGVDGYLHFSPIDSVVISPRYTDISMSESQQSDSERSSVGIDWIHEIDPVSRLRVGGDAAKVSFDDSLQDYDSQTITVGYEAALARLSYSLSGGVMKFDRETQDDVNGHSIRASLNYRADTFDVGGNFVSELTDSSIGLSSSEFALADFQANDTNFAQVDVIERSQLDLYWRQRLGVSKSVDFLLGASKDDYETQLLDQDRAYAEIGYRQELSAFLSFNASARYEHIEFLDDPLGREYDDKTVSVGTRYRFTQHLDASLSLSREDRSADDRVSEYIDNIAMLTINYRLY